MPLGDCTYQIVGTGSKRRHVQNSSSFYYVPLYDTLRALISNPAVSREIECHSHRPLPGGVLRDFCDGDHYDAHPLFSCDKTTLQLVAYYDELEICNPLGAAAKLHKIGIVFMFLANIRPQFRSTLRSTQLVAVAKSSDIRQYGIDEVLNPFIRDLQRLSTEGIDICINGISVNYKGALLAFLGDNLASHSIGGFKESMSFAFRFCRTCMATHATSGKHFVANKFLLRSPEEHAAQCKQLDGPLKEHYSKIYGINRKAALEDVPYFSVATCLPHDIMHDLLEGAVTYEIKVLLKYCIGKKYFTLDCLNGRINAFDYGSAEESNKPFQIEFGSTKEDIKLRQTASTSWLLSRILPLLIGDKIPVDDNAWHCYQLLLKILDICTAQSCTHNAIAYLGTLIEEHHVEFCRIYELSLIPKQHFMVHYPQQILRMGPLINSWNMRNEAKFKLCKKVSKFGNFKNICYSVSMKHQRWMCLQLQSKNFLEMPPANGGNSKTCLLSEELPDFVACFKVVFPNVADSAPLQHYMWAKFHHYMYRKGGIVISHIQSRLGYPELTYPET